MTPKQLMKWIDKTNPNQKGISREERARLSAMRNAIAKEAGTTMATIRVQRCREEFGEGLVERIEKAIEKHCSIEDKNKSGSTVLNDMKPDKYAGEWISIEHEYTLKFDSEDWCHVFFGRRKVWDCDGVYARKHFRA